MVEYGTVDSSWSVTSRFLSEIVCDLQQFYGVIDILMNSDGWLSKIFTYLATQKYLMYKQIKPDSIETLNEAIPVTELLNTTVPLY